MKNVRIWFSKTGPVKYISHLDLTRCMARALKLSRLPVWYTEGFNPHIYMTFAMPLSLGVSGERECMDIRLTEDAALTDVACRLAECLPEDISVLEAAEPVLGFDAIAYAEYVMRIETPDPWSFGAALLELLEQESIMVLKHSKKGDKEFDIKPHIFVSRLEYEPETALTIWVRTTCSQEGSVNPSLLLDAVKTGQTPEIHVEIHRKRLLTKDFSDMR